MSRVEDKLAQVVGQASFVGLEALLSSVFTSMIDIDSDRFSELNSKSN